MRTHTLSICLLTVLTLTLMTACGRPKIGGKPPEFFFEDPQIIELCVAISRGKETEVKRLLDSGIDVNTVGKDGVTPLFWALASKRKESFKLLLERGANPNLKLKKDNGASVTSLACRMKKEDYFKLVLEHGGDVNVSNNIQEAPIYDAIINKDFERVRALVAAGANLDHQDISGVTPMMTAAMLNQYDMAFYFLEKGANPRVKNKLGNDGVPKNDVTYSVQKSHRLMDRTHWQHEWLLKFAGELRKRGMEVNLD